MCMASLIILSFSFLRRFFLFTEEKKAAKQKGLYHFVRTCMVTSRPSSRFTVSMSAPMPA